MSVVDSGTQTERVKYHDVGYTNGWYAGRDSAAKVIEQLGLFVEAELIRRLSPPEWVHLITTKQGE